MGISRCHFLVFIQLTRRSSGRRVPLHFFRGPRAPQQLAQSCTNMLCRIAFLFPYTTTNAYRADANQVIVPFPDYSPPPNL